MYFHWFLKIRNWKQYFACFHFPLQIEFWEQFLFSVHFELPNKFFSFKNRKLFLKTENKRKKTVTKHTLNLFYHLTFLFSRFLFSIIPLFHSTLSTKWILKEKNLKINTQLTPSKTKLSNGSYVSDFVIVELENISIKKQI